MQVAASGRGVEGAGWGTSLWGVTHWDQGKLVLALSHSKKLHTPGSSHLPLTFLQ